MSRNIAETARTLMMITVMIASAIMPMMPEAGELRESPEAMHAVISVGSTTLFIDEGLFDHYEIVLDEAPDGVVVITPTTGSGTNYHTVSVEPAYLKFTKANFDAPQSFTVSTYYDIDGADRGPTVPEQPRPRFRKDSGPFPVVFGGSN